MLAETADDAADALAHLGRAAGEHKIDGARVRSIATATTCACSRGV
jgi:hypothetical protein